MRLAARLVPWWPWLRRAGWTLFFGLVAWLLVSEARRIDWQEVLAAGRQVPLQVLLLAGGLAAASHLLYSCFDLLGRHYTGHGLRPRSVMKVTFISYAFNLNLGALVGAVALRYRLYGRLGLRYGVITQVLSLSMLTNWLGYVLLAGLLFAVWPPTVPAGWQMGTAALRLMGAGLLLVGTTYLLACAFSRQRSFVLRSHRIELPELRMALLQTVMSLSNWILIGSLIYVLLPAGPGWLLVMSILLVAAFAGVIAHVPAGLGVLEAVFVTLLGHAVPKHEVLAALLLYRAFYYLLPLGLAALLYALTEAKPQGPDAAA